MGNSEINLHEMGWQEIYSYFRQLKKEIPEDTRKKIEDGINIKFSIIYAIKGNPYIRENPKNLNVTINNNKPIHILDYENEMQERRDLMIEELEKLMEKKPYLETFKKNGD